MEEKEIGVGGGGSPGRAQPSGRMWGLAVMRGVRAGGRWAVWADWPGSAGKEMNFLFLISFPNEGNLF
jgi:hypothetical protein